jgi:hypothetical protein
MQELHKNAVYSPYWQWFRMQLKGVWKQYTRENLFKLDEYLGDRRDITKLWRVLNLLNGVRMGFEGMGIGKGPESIMIAKFRDGVSESYQSLKDQGFQIQEVTEEQILEEWRDVPKFYRDQIIGDLSIRYWKSKKSKNREDLKWFLELIGAKI